MERYASSGAAHRLDGLESTRGLMSLRTNREKVAILLAALSKETAVSLLQKFDGNSITRLLESSGHLGDLSNGDFEPVVKEFFDEFSDALGISAGSKHLIPLLEAAFPQEKVSEFLGLTEVDETVSVWSKFTLGMETALVPYMLDEHEQTATLILSKLPLELASRCMSLLPRELTHRILSRSLSLRPAVPDALALLEQMLEDEFFSRAVESPDGKWVERVAGLVNRMEREQAQNFLAMLSQSSPEQSAKLRKFIFMFEDLDKMDTQSRSRLFDKVSVELVTPALWGMATEFKESVLASLGARARRMAESELASDDGVPRADTGNARKKISEIAIAMSKKGEIKLPEESSGAAQTIGSSAR
jgi:flagellar motor switch protein FliG